MARINLEDIRDLAEDVELEAKKAVGSHGRGELPTSFFQTYSALANTNGGIVLFGVEEKPKGVFSVIGLSDCRKVIQDLWNGLHNQQRVSTNLLRDEDIEVIEVEGKQVLKISIHRAARRRRPVFIGKNPFLGTYQRRNEGDYKCEAETVKRMLAEQVEDARDARVLPNYGLNDLQKETITAYRNVFKVTRPDHPWNEFDELEFLRMIGGWGLNRDTKDEGLTIAGLLMFGKLRPILDELPNYVVDYQERPEPKAEPRWIDRLTTDGMWSGNLYDFYRLTIRKLYTDLKVPFKLEGDQRMDDTPVHEALREALVNTLIHADYSGRLSILIVKRPDMFGFRNPGTMRVPIDIALQGGESDCRNRNLQKMFQLVGLGEQAGSGLPKIYRNWERQSWRKPLLYEKFDRDQTLLELRMASLLPDDVLVELDHQFGDRFRSLPDVERLTLATAATEGQVTHSRLKSITDSHPHDLSKTLSSLVREGFLESGGAGRGTYYYLPGEEPQEGEDPFVWQAVGRINRVHDTGKESESFQQVVQRSQHLAPDSQHLIPDSQHLEKLESLAGEIRTTRKAPRAQVVQIILSICREHYLSLRELSQILARKPATLQNHYLAKLVSDGSLELLYPDKVNHPKQRYRTSARCFSTTDEE